MANPPILANQSAQTYTTTIAITPLSFTNTGAAITSCNSSPSLPTGLSVAVNGSTCEITGTPSASVAAADYTITGAAADSSEDTAIVNEKYPNIKILFISGFANEESSDISLNTLARNILHKPFTSTTLLKRVKEVFIV